MTSIVHRRAMQEGPGTVTFWWKVSSEANYDWLSFYVDGVLQDRISGEVGWQQKSYPLGEDGTHALIWVYSKDSGSESGSDRGWVDYLQWTPSGGGGGSSATDWEQITYTYDPSGRRIAKDVDGVVTRYVYDGDHCIAEYDANDVLLRKYIHGPCIDEPICMIEAAGGYAGTYYYHYDALGSVVALSDADGDTVQVYEYDVYGQVAASDPNHPNRFLFTGREFDTETGLYYYRARYYNPTIGRFLQTDPIGYGDGLHWYAYCGNAPTALADSSGMASNFGFSMWYRPDDPKDPEYWRWGGYATALMFSWKNDDGTTGSRLFGGMEEWVTWAQQGGKLDDGTAPLFPDGWETGEAGWGLTAGADAEWREWWFWRIKAIMWLDHGLGRNLILLEAKLKETGRTLGLQGGECGYAYEKDILYWSYDGEKGLDCPIELTTPYNWGACPPLSALAHEFNHAYYDIMSGANNATRSAGMMECSAVRWENRIRRALFNCNPTCSNVWPRPGYQAWVPDVKGATTAEEAWKIYKDTVRWAPTPPPGWPN